MNKLPPNFHVNYKLFAEDLRALLEAQPKHPDGKMLRKLVHDLGRFEELGGFPAEFQGDESVTYVGANGKLAEHATFVHELVREEGKNGWLEMMLEPPVGPYR